MNVDEPDDLDRLLGIDVNDPLTRLARDLTEADRSLLDDLRRLRREGGITQTEVARRLGVSQSSVSEFERIGGDPRLSTIRRYAMAIRAMINHEVVKRESPDEDEDESG